ncbi:MAG: MFS transporter [Buchnera aphidicola (Chaetogeoica yunlongensis)]
MKLKIFSCHKNYIQRGSQAFTEVTIALFLAGFSTFSLLYCVQPILFLFSKEFSLSPVQSSLFLSAPTAMMSIGMLFAGPLSDSIGRKVVMSTSLFLASFLTFFCSGMSTWENIVLMRALTGLALSGVASVAMTYLSEEMHPGILSFSIGLYISGNTIGGFAGRFLSSLLCEYFSWNVALEFISFLAFAFSILFVFLLPTSKNFSSVNLNFRHIVSNFLRQWKHPVTSKLFCMGCLLMGSFITIFSYIGYRLILKPFYFNQTSIGLLSVIYLIGVYSSPQAGILIRKYKKSIILITALMMMIFGILVTQWNTMFLVILGLILFSAGFYAAHSVTSTWISQQSKESKGSTSSIYLFSYYLGSSVFGTVSGIFWSVGEWLGISIFVISFLLIGIFFAMKLLKYQKTII